MTRRLRLGLAVLLLLAASAAALPAGLRVLLWRWESNPLLRGQKLAAELGCPVCHQPWAGVEIPNPGSRWGSVPRFGGGNAMMYVSSPEEIAEFIRFGAPKSWLDDPEIRARLGNQHLRMPAYADRLSETELADLVVWVGVVEGVDRAQGEGVAEGRELARQHGCLSCHAVEGAGGLPNPGSLGGFIPGFSGRNFEDLVKDEAEFREWVREGTSARLASKAWVRFFWNRQKLQMPAYRDELSEEEISALWQWVVAVRERYSS